MRWNVKKLRALRPEWTHWFYPSKPGVSTGANICRAIAKTGLAGLRRMLRVYGEPDFLHGGVLMRSACAGSLLTHLSQVPDPRGRKGRRHPLSAMLTAVVCGLLCGNRSYSALVEWLHDLPVDVWHWMGYTRRPPKLDCFRDLLMKLDPAVLECLLTHWITEVLGLVLDEAQLQAISFDGKTLCGSLRAHARAVHLLSAVDHATGCVLSQMRVDGKTNEHKACAGTAPDTDAQGPRRRGRCAVLPARSLSANPRLRRPLLRRGEGQSTAVIAGDVAGTDCPRCGLFPPSCSANGPRSVTRRRPSTRLTAASSDVH